MQPHGGGTGAAVVGEQNRAGRLVGALAHVGGVAEVGDRLALVIFHLQRAGGGRVLDGTAVDAHGTCRLGVQQFGRVLGGVIRGGFSGALVVSHLVMRRQGEGGEAEAGQQAQPG